MIMIVSKCLYSNNMLNFTQIGYSIHWKQHKENSPKKISSYLLLKSKLNSEK